MWKVENKVWKCEVKVGGREQGLEVEYKDWREREDLGTES